MYHVKISFIFRVSAEVNDCGCYRHSIQTMVLAPLKFLGQTSLFCHTFHY